jgi:hypothetical protein
MSDKGASGIDVGRITRAASYGDGATGERRMFSMSCKDVRKVGIAMSLALWMAWIATLPASAAPLAGMGTWQSQALDAKGTWSVDLTRTEDNITGGLTLTGSPMTTGGSISGMITDGDTVTFGVLDNNVPVATFTGTLKGGTVSGSYRTEIGDRGVWSGTLTTTKP